ncbi:MAG: hypothetical protein R2877_01090 [Bdellovibrionota bacterium]
MNSMTTFVDGCVNLEGHYLIRVDGDSYVLEDIEQDEVLANTTDIDDP